MNVGQKVTLSAEWVKRDKKDGTGSYECFEIKIGQKIKKLLFLSDAELELLILSLGK